MIGLLIFALVVIIVVALILWAVESTPIRSPFNWIIRVLVILIAALVIAGRAGVV
jgi:hypothetical protein